MSFELGEGRITANPDFDGVEEKTHAVFLADLYSPGSTMPSDLEPHSGEVVEFTLAKDANPESFKRIANIAGFTIRNA